MLIALHLKRIGTNLTSDGWLVLVTWAGGVVRTRIAKEGQCICHGQLPVVRVGNCVCLYYLIKAAMATFPLWSYVVRPLQRGYSGSCFPVSEEHMLRKLDVLCAVVTFHIARRTERNVLHLFQTLQLLLWATQKYNWSCGQPPKIQHVMLAIEPNLHLVLWATMHTCTIYIII